MINYIPHYNSADFPSKSEEKIDFKKKKERFFLDLIMNKHK